jgi:hypothetical protein
MRSLHKHLAVSLLLLGHAYCFTIRAEPLAETPLPKSELDWFYQPPDGFEKAALGTILRSRKTPRPIGINVTSVEFGVGDAWQLLYRTQDGLRQPEATVVTILKPKQPNPRGNLWSESYFSVSDVCMMRLRC